VGHGVAIPLHPVRGRRHDLTLTDHQRRDRDLAPAGGAGRATAPALVAGASRFASVFLVLGERPLPRLDAAQRAGLVEFVEGRFPAVVAEARPTHPPRVLVPLDHDAPDDPALAAVRAAGQRLHRAGPWRFAALAECTFPPWEDVSAYLMKHAQRPGPEVIDEVKRLYDQLTSGRTVSFDELAALIDRHLQEA